MQPSLWVATILLATAAPLSLLALVCSIATWRESTRLCARLRPARPGPGRSPHRRPVLRSTSPLGGTLTLYDPEPLWSVPVVQSDPRRHGTP